MCSVCVRAQARVRVLDHSQSSASMRVSNGCPLPVQRLCQVPAGSIPHNCIFPLAMAALALVWSCAVEQEGLERALGTGQGMGCGNPGISHSSRPLLIHCLHERQQWPPSPYADAMSGLSRQPLPHCGAVSGSKQGQTRHSAQAGACWVGQTGQSSGQFQSTSSVLFWEQASMHPLLKGV